MKDKSKLLSVVSHASCLFTSTILSLLVPVGIGMYSDDDVTLANAVEAINFQISMFIYAIVGLITAFVGVGFLVLIAVGAWNLIAPIVKIVQVLNNPSQPARYGLIFRFVK